jgi:hypothetical protein
MCGNWFIPCEEEILRACSHTRLNTALHALSLVEKAEPVHVRFTLCFVDQWSKWMQDGCKVYLDSYMASNGSCFMVTWAVLKNHLLEVCVTQNRETMRIWKLTTIDLWYLIMCEDLAWIEIHYNGIWLTARSHMTSQLYLRTCDHTALFWKCLGTASKHFFWALTNSWSRLLARVWSGPKLSRAQDHVLGVVDCY